MNRARQAGAGAAPAPLDEAAAEFSRDGVTCVRGAVGSDDVRRLQEAVDRVLAAPSRFGEAYGGDAGAASFRGDKFMWMRDPDFRWLALESAVPKVAARVMGSASVHLFYDHLLVKEPGSEVPTKWHNDQNYWPVQGTQICSVWLACDPVDGANGRVEFVRGSHRWAGRYQPMDFTRMAAIADPGFEPVPDIDVNRAAFDIAAWDLAPGDCLIFSGLCIHGATGNHATRRRRAVSVRYLGDDVRWAVKAKSIPFPTAPGLAHGDLVRGDLFPLAWPQSRPVETVV
jgi:ectoine hydroxylase-related dioxygenase (phytanoyl-CoA dioxygenase family)